MSESESYRAFTLGVLFIWKSFIPPMWSCILSKSLVLGPGQRLLSCSRVGIISVQRSIVSDSEIIGRAGSRKLVGGVIALPYWELGCSSI